ncbi:unnamed protein product [Strongylus vulgaris]|uniref:ABC transporter domain-containing protein n=1 Tax=Strongylus vulgaris TaxID=40348 RepID=A0A3P7JTD4_STRVU|nr:unnamed protein product [Strongylus vulgaris]
MVGNTDLKLLRPHRSDTIPISEAKNEEHHSWHEEDDAAGEPALLAEKVSKVWETTGELAVNDFSMRAYRGQVTVLLGHNGAGKSTMYAMICGTVPATKGKCMKPILSMHQF